MIVLNSWCCLSLSAVFTKVSHFNSSASITGTGCPIGYTDSQTQSPNRKAGCFHNTVKTAVGGKKHLRSDKTEYECCDHRHISINMCTPIWNSNCFFFLCLSSHDTTNIVNLVSQEAWINKCRFYLIGGWKKDLCLSIKVTFTRYDFYSKH